MKKWVILIELLLLTMGAYAADRALWVWGMSHEIVNDDRPEDRNDFYSFVAAPHGNTNAAIRTIFLCADHGVVTNYPTRLQEFIADAHSRGLKIEYLTGAPLWALTITNPVTGDPYHIPGTHELIDVLQYNATARPEERFDGIQYDVEPYLLRRENGHPYDWGNPDDCALIWEQYITMLKRWQAMCDEHNEATNDDVRFGVAIPRWWDAEEAPPANHETVQDIVDYVAIMAYDTRGWNAIDHSRSEMNYAEGRSMDEDTTNRVVKPDSVYLGLETIDVTWKERCDPSFYDYLFMHSSSFFKKGNESLEELVRDIENEFHRTGDEYKDYESYAGVAIHYYEDARAGELAYRNLGMLAHTPHAPVVYLDYPCGGEILAGKQTLRSRIYDEDGDALTVTWSASTNDGVSWFDISETIDVSIWDPGSYLFRVDVVEDKTNGLHAFDVSDAPIQIVSEQLDTHAPYKVSNVHADSTYPYPVDEIRIRWDATNDEGPEGVAGVLGYYYSTNEVLDLSRARFTRALCGILPVDTAGSIPVWIRAVDRSGNISSAATAVITVYADTDKDGVADAIDLDIDGDGISNEQEKVAGSDPMDVASFPDGLVQGIWRFEEKTLTNDIPGMPGLKETLGNAEYRVDHDLAPSNGVIYMSALTDTLAVANKMQPESISALTIEMWIKPEENRYTTYIPLAFEGDVDYGISLLLEDDLGSISVRGYYTGHKHETKYGALHYKHPSIYDGQWHHIACSYNGYDQCMTLFIDGKEVSRYVDHRLPQSFKRSRPILFFDAISAFDGDNSPPDWPEVFVDIANSAQFENNDFSDWQNMTRYVGLADDLRVTLVALPAEKLGYYEK